MTAPCLLSSHDDNMYTYNTSSSVSEFIHCNTLLFIVSQSMTEPHAIN